MKVLAACTTCIHRGSLLSWIWYWACWRGRWVWHRSCLNFIIYPNYLIYSLITTVHSYFLVSFFIERKKGPVWLQWRLFRNRSLRQQSSELFFKSSLLTASKRNPNLSDRLEKFATPFSLQPCHENKEAHFLITSAHTFISRANIYWEIWPKQAPPGSTLGLIFLS